MMVAVGMKKDYNKWDKYRVGGAHIERQATHCPGAASRRGGREMKELPTHPIQSKRRIV